MQAVILAAGQGKRMGYLTISAPKTMLKIGTKTLLEFRLDAMPPQITEVIIVIGYKGEIVQRYFGDSYKHLKIRYVVQPEATGTGQALWAAKDILLDRFIVMTGDDIYSPDSIRDIVHFENAMTTKHGPSFKNAGDVITTEDGYLAAIEFDTEGVRTSINMDICLYALTKSIFDFDLVKKDDQEWGLPHTLVSIARHMPIKVLETNFWMKINTPEDLMFANKMLNPEQ